jgi:thioredoxin-dependent peroxiredoxin
MAKAIETAKAKASTEALKVGDKAPDFCLKTDDGKEVTLKDFKGKRVLLFFFPKANTPG